MNELPRENLKRIERPLVEVRNLKKYFNTRDKKTVHAVDGISFEIRKGNTLGIVGESGCGKSTVGNLLSRLLDSTEGEFLLEGQDVFRYKSKKDLFSMRKRVQMIFQDPHSSLNPKKLIRKILEAPFVIHKLANKKTMQDKVLELINLVGLEPYVLDQYPYELDGGRRQLVGIARALSVNPEFIICDEPVSSLDVSVQATILNVLIDLQKEFGLTYLFISHDLSVVKHISDRIAVMYLGGIVEIADTYDVFENTSHPYTIALLSAIPKMGTSGTQRIVLSGDVPSPLDPPGNQCRFASRCWMAKKKCTQVAPNMQEVTNGHKVSCHFWKEAQEKAKDILLDL